MFISIIIICNSQEYIYLFPIQQMFIEVLLGERQDADCGVWK